MDIESRLANLEGDVRKLKKRVADQDEELRKLSLTVAPTPLAKPKANGLMGKAGR